MLMIIEASAACVRSICHMQMDTSFFLSSLIIKNVRTEIISCCFGGVSKEKIQSIGSALS